jgi:hypothetical protein
MPVSQKIAPSRYNEDIYPSSPQVGVTGSQARMARAALQWRVADVGKAAHVALATVRRLELEYAIDPADLAAIRGALEAAGVVFISDNGEGPGVRLRKNRGPTNSVGRG